MATQTVDLFGIRVTQAGKVSLATDERGAPYLATQFARARATAARLNQIYKTGGLATRCRAIRVIAQLTFPE